MRNRALLGIAATAAGMALLAWPTPREEKSRNAIPVVHGGAPPSPIEAWIKPASAVASARGSTSTSAAGPARYAWEVGEAADDDAPRDPGIWATPADFAPTE